MAESLKAREIKAGVTGFAARISQKMREDGDFVLNVSRDRTRHLTLARESSAKSENKYGTTTGNLPDESESIYQLLEYRNPEGRKLLLASIDNSKTYTANIADQPIIGLIFRPALDEDKNGKDFYHLIFSNGYAETIVEVERLHEHFLTEMSFRATMTQLLLIAAQLRVISANDNNPREFHGIKMRKQDEFSSRVLTTVLNNKHYKPLHINPEKFGFNPTFP